MSQTNQKNESGNWSENDYQIGLNFIRNNEDQANSDTILYTEKDVSVISPSRLPIFGAGFYGIFMLAPIVLFMLVISYLIIIILTANSLETQSQLLFCSVCLFFLWALTKILKLIMSKHELFPRKYFSTLGPRGVAGHYSKLHFPFHSTVTIRNEEIESIRSYSTFFLPGFILGIFKVYIVAIYSKEGKILKIPFYASAKEASAISDKILQLINPKLL